MKRIIIIAVFALLTFTHNAFAWGEFGHKAIVEIAKRHLTEKAKQNIAKYFSYDITDDAVYMDDHRYDEPILYTKSWHVYNVDENGVYDMNPRIRKGDAVLSIKIADYNLSNLERLTDSAVVMNVRMLIHFAGDIHCPTHSFVPGPRCFWPCELNGKKYKSFHSVYDYMPDEVYEGMSYTELAAKLDNASKGEIKRIQKGYIHEWINEIGKRNSIIYKWNPHNTKVLNPKTIELSHELIDLQMRNAGYRLALLLNRYFDHK